jgi:hypothetical protein
MSASAPFVAVLAIVVVAPFERPLLVLPGGFTLTTVETVLIVGAALIAAYFGMRGVRSDDPIPLRLPGALFLAALAIAALAAPAEQGNAVRFVLRMLMASALFVMTQRVVTTRKQARCLAWTMVVVATVVALIALLEVAQAPFVLSALTAFRPGFHVVAGQLRATSTLLYPTIASMYLELAFAFGLWLLLDPGRRADSLAPPASSAFRAFLPSCLVFAALVLIAAGITATFTRAGLIGMFAVMVLMAAMQLTRIPRARAGLGVLTTLAATIVVVVFLSHAPELLATRLVTEGSQAWYGATYRVPASLELTTGEKLSVPVELINTGRLSWDSSAQPAFALGYHWLRGGTDEVVQFDGARTAFPEVIAPGRRVQLSADVFAPGQPGSYTLVWDVVHESRAWLSTEGVPPSRTHVTVTGPVVTTVETTMERLPAASVRPARPALWSAALQIASERPCLGIGPDNYRLAYGPYLGLAHWDRRVHANNMYLELLAGAGLIGFAAIVWLFAAAGWRLWQRAREAAPASHVAAVAELGAWLVVAGHGLVDSFLSFTTTYVSFAVAAGLAFSPGLVASTEVDAHRI